MTAMITIETELQCEKGDTVAQKPRISLFIDRASQCMHE